MLHKCLCFHHFKHTSSSRKHYPTVIEELCHQFSLADLRKSTNNFDENRIIGHGVFGIVYKGCLQLNGATDYTVALKRMKGSTAQGFRVLKNEIELLCQIRHPNLVSLIGFCDHTHEKIIVYEYMPNGSLDDHLYCSHMEPLSWKKRLKICIGAAHGLHYLHTGTKRTIFHRDIKPRNILLDNNMVPKLSSFGISLQGPHFMSKPKPIEVKNIAGTHDYMAPEQFWEGTFTDKCDVYSFGMVLLEVLCAKNTNEIIIELRHGLVQIEYEEVQKSFYTTSTFRKQFYCMLRIPVKEIINPILIGKIAPQCWEVFKDITEKCLKYDPNERPTIGEVELELENALSLQEEADIIKTNGDYTLLSNSIIKLELASDREDNGRTRSGSCSES